MNKEELFNTLASRYSFEELYDGVLIKTNIGEYIYKYDGRFTWLENVSSGTTAYSPVGMNDINLELNN